MQRIARANLPVKPAETSNAQVPHRFTIVSVRRLIPLFLLLLALPGCSRDDGRAELPAACGSDATTFVEALGSAPSPVTVGRTPISDCLAKDATVGDVQLVGSVLVEAAQRLGEEGAVVELGYLVGALRRGAEQSQGLHLEIVRRVELEAAPFADSPAFARGVRAGRTSG